MSARATDAPDQPLAPVARVSLPPDAPQTSPGASAPGVFEILEAPAAVYFDACKRVARVLTRFSQKRPRR